LLTTVDGIINKLIYEWLQRHIYIGFGGTFRPLSKEGPLEGPLEGSLDTSLDQFMLLSEISKVLNFQTIWV